MKNTCLKDKQLIWWFASTHFVTIYHLQSWHQLQINDVTFVNKSSQIIINCTIFSFYVKHMFILLYIILFWQEANCINANETIRYVATCPENKTSDSFIERSYRKNCSQYQSCNDKPLYYHCVRYKEGLVEVCSERTTISGLCLTLININKICDFFCLWFILRTIVENTKFYHLFIFLLFEGKCCTIFEKGLGRVVEDNTKHCSTCDFYYFSDESGKTVKA